MPVPDAFANTPADVPPEVRFEQAYWSAFGDPVLDGLIEAAISENHDVRIALANLRQSRELLLEARFELYPIVPAQGGYTRERRSGISAPGLSTAQRDQDIFSGGLDATWELDFFGRVRRNVEARRADVETFEASRRDVVVSVLAEVATNYFELRGLQDRLRVARENAANQQATLDLTQSLLEGGRGTDFDTARAESQLQTTLATIPPLEAAGFATIYRISVLTGRLHLDLVSTLEDVRPLPQLPEQVVVGSPEGLLRRRPDIQVVERSLAAATARVGVATADLFPRVTFNGSIGFEVGDAGDLFDSGSDRYAFGPAITWAAFDLGRVRARIRAADARVESLLAEYQVTVLEALEETDGALVLYSRERARLEHLVAAEAASRRAADLSRRRYQDGVDDFLTVLDAELRLLETQDLLADARTRSATALIAVYKALGGGWEVAGVEERLPGEDLPPDPSADG